MAPVGDARPLKVWIDVENPPQVQYLLPFRDAFEEAGADVVLTARDYGDALALLQARGGEFHAVGASAGASRLRKGAAAFTRGRELVRFLKSHGRPDALICASRSAALAARRLRIPTFAISDYEHADKSVFRLTGSYLLHPDVIDPEVFADGGPRRSRLIPFAGIKEDLSFSGIDLDAIQAHRFPELEDERLVKVLFRPPAEESHYYQQQSKGLALDVLEALRGEKRAVVVFSARYDWQERYLDGEWVNPPVVMHRPVPFVELLKGVDLVVSSGGTMLREAAYLGVPAYSIFRSSIGAVDRYLESIGRLRFLESTEDRPKLRLAKAGTIRPLRSNPRLMEELMGEILSRAPSPDARRSGRFSFVERRRQEAT